MIVIVTILALILIKLNDGAPTKMERMTIAKTNITDLESSATGYTYEQRQNYPVTYVHYTNYGSGRYYDTPLPIHYIVDGSSKGAVAPVALSVPQTAALYERPLISYTNVGQKLNPYMQQRLSYVKTGNDHMEAQGVYIVPQKPLPPYYVHLSNEKVIKGKDGNQGHANEKSNEDVKETYDKEKEYNDEHGDNDDNDDYEDDDEDDDEDNSEYNDAHKTYHSKGFNHDHLGHSQKLYNKDHDHLGDIGSSFQIEEHSSNGKKSDSAYNSYDTFDEEQKKTYDSAEKAGHSNLKGKQKKEYTNTSGSYGQHDDLKKGEEGAKHEHSSYHKKGGKTNGFHKVYHKDEYKKNTDFYDENHKDGQFSKHFAFDQHNNAKEGDYQKESHHDSGLDQWDKTKKDDFKKGHDVSRNQEHHSEKDEDSYHKDYSDYSKETGERAEKKHGYSKTHDDY